MAGPLKGTTLDLIPVTIGKNSRAYYFASLIEVGIINDTVGPDPVAVYADAETRNVHVYLRQFNDQTLTLAIADSGDYLIDHQTGTHWSIARGLPKDGGQDAAGLLLIPYISSFDWAWLDFHPNSTFYQ